MQWHQHINYISSKISKSLYLLRKVKNIIPKSSLKLLYHGYTQSVMNYGILIWGPMCNKNVFNRIVKLQKKAIRIIAGASYNAQTKPLFQELKILTVDNLVELELGKFIYKFVKKILPNPIIYLFETNDQHHNYNTRSGKFPRVAKHKTAIFNKSFLCKGPTLWNNLDNSIRSAKSLKSFSRNFKNLMLTT